MEVSDNSTDRFPENHVKVPLGARIGGTKPMRNMLLVIVLGAVLVFAGSGGAQQPSPSEIRRIVTALDASGKAVVLFDSRLALASGRANLWITDSYPPGFSSKNDLATKPVGRTSPPENGTVFRVIEFPPVDPATEAKLEPNLVQRTVDPAPKKGLPMSHPLMHRTRTVDYMVILSGEIDMKLDDSVVHLKPGDVVIQQATNHAWINRGTQPCRILAVLIDAQEP
jgi:mannose-6-phosphate isomerase-like protein (cupin superfamily)